MNLKVKHLIIIFGLGFLLGYLSHKKDKFIEEKIIEVKDTVLIDNPIPYIVEKEKKVYVQIPNDTIIKTDSIFIYIPVDIISKEYKDSTYKAIVKGAKIGDIEPTLDYIEVYSNNRVILQETKQPFIRPYIKGSIGNKLIGIGGGVEIKEHHGFGANVMFMQEDIIYAFEYIYKF